MECGWSGAGMQEGVHEGLMIYRKRMREASKGVVSLSQQCVKGSSGCGWSVTDVRETVCGLRMASCRHARRFP